MLALIQLLLTTFSGLGLSNAPAPPAAPSDSLVSFPSSLDCNGNGIDDSVDIAIGTSGDLDQNGIPDECQGLASPAGWMHSSAGEAGMWLSRPLKAVAAQSPPRSSPLRVSWSRGRFAGTDAWQSGLGARVP
ncbi:MAG: hypothetical protein ACI8QZ_004347 [Chlamydiales bacterium]|jgi:hypothetical protein